MTEIHHLVEYVPYYQAHVHPGWRERFPDTWRILDFKDGKKSAIQHYAGLVKGHLSSALDLN